MVSGASVSLGYLNNEKNKDFVKKNNLNYFYTSDLGYFDDELNLYIVGRKGFTVKVNGFRVNLKEIESHLISYPSIHQVVAFKLKKSNDFICLAVEPKNSFRGKIILGEVRSFLRKKIPSYMIPKKIFVFDELPKNINGKIDRKLIAIQSLKRLGDNEQY